MGFVNSTDKFWDGTVMTRCVGMGVLGLFVILWGLMFWYFWIGPTRAHRKLQRNGFGGPPPCFPLGNIPDMMNTKKNKKKKNSNITTPSASTEYSSIFGSPTTMISHDLHSTVFPHFARWQKSHGKVFTYWQGTEPFLYVAEPEFIRQMSEGVLGKNWGKPALFKRDRKPMFGNGLNMVEGDDWVRHRHLISPAFSPHYLKGMVSLMVESTMKMLDRWSGLISSGRSEIDVEKEILRTAAEILGKTSFGINYENGREVFEKLREIQATLFQPNRYLGVPLSQFIMNLKQTLVAKRLGDEIDGLLLSIISARRKASPSPKGGQTDLLGQMLAAEGKALTPRELVDECKTLFYGGHETSAMTVTWTLLLLAMHPQWQSQLRQEIREVVGDGEIDPTKLNCLKKMGWVMNETLRLYSSAPNAQRQAREDIRVNDSTIPNGTNIWIDLVAMHHDPTLWGDAVNEFRPERFEDDLHGGCKHKMGFLPFGFGGRMCVGRNLSIMEYKIMLSSILTRFSFSLSPTYTHSPSYLLSLKPAYGLPLVLQPLES
ncbi:cytokinin hydroxylase [Malania oleifera]|uniref:cytokinin hydroxylase n=1 Tax=Malania oleifera TaxID=397392 RepID=UPI0025ADA2C6|nr:cytokinin hydroxylase [Malania oleifera]